VRITIALAGLSEAGSRIMIRNDFDRKDSRAARVTSTVGWFGLANRKRVCPPDNLLQSLRAIARSDVFKTFPTAAVSRGRDDMRTPFI
jgi:acyl-CoA thioester hydrolase